MRLQSTPKATLAACALCAVGLLATATGAAQAQSGGLSVKPGTFEAPARPGKVGAVGIANTTDRPMRVRVFARPWLQSRSGSVSPNRRKVMGKLRPNRAGFRLGAGKARRFRFRLARVPRRGSLYGALEVTGAPIRKGGKGIRVAYRLVTSLRFFPRKRARRFKARPGRLYVKGSARRGALFLAVKNAGNTIDPIEGRVRITGRNRTLSGIISPKSILPGRTVNLRLTRLRGTLPKGRYRLGVRLTQKGRVVAGFRRAIRLR